MTELTPEERRQIYEEEKSRVDLQRTIDKQRFAPSRRTLVGAACLLLAAGLGGVAAVRSYNVHVLKEKLAEAIGRDLGLTETVLKIESDSSKMTFVEVFELCNKSIENRTNLIVDLRGLNPEMDNHLKGRLIAYLNLENEFIRSKREFYRKLVAHSSALDSYVQMASGGSSYSFEYSFGRTRELREQLLTAGTAVMKGADDFLAMYDRIAQEETSIGSEIRGAGFRFDPVFQRYGVDNRGRAITAQDGVRLLAARLE